MDFILNSLRVLGPERLLADFEIRHPDGALRGQVSTEIRYAMSDTMAQIVVRARETLERAIEEIA